MSSPSSSQLSKSVVLLALIGSAAACTSATDADSAAGTEDEVRLLKPKEFVGFLQYGDEVAASYTAARTYHAYRFRANAFDQLEITLTAETPGTAVWATLMDDDGNDLTPATDSGASTKTLRYTMPGVFAQRTLVFREAGLKAMNVRIKLASTGIREPAIPFGGTPGTYAAPAPFTGEVQDVPLRCLHTQHYRDSLKVDLTETSGIVSLDLGGGTPKVVGTDGALGAPAGKAEYGLARVALSKVPSSEFANATTLKGAAAYDAYRHLLQLTNVGKDQLRVEYALESVAGNTGGVASTLSCVGLLKN